MNDTQIQLRIRGEQRQRIIDAAAKRNMKLSEFVRWATAEWALALERQDRQELPSLKLKGE